MAATADPPTRVPLAWVEPFLTRLAATGNVRRSAAFARVTPKVMYAHAHRNPSFAAQMVKARAEFFSSLVPPEGVARG